MTWRSPRALVVFVVGFACLWLTVATSHGQTATATLSGIVVDESAAVLPDVSLTLVNTETALSRATTANNQGTFTFSFVAPGRYTLRAQRDGFAPAQFPDIVLNVGDNLTVRVALKVGSLTDSVSVVANSSAASQSGSVATVVDRRFVENLPINGRTFQSLISLAPGVVLTKVVSLESGQFSVNGQRANSNYFMVDGVSANIGVPPPGNTPGQLATGSLPGLSRQGGTNSLVSVDAMEEFRLETSSFAAEYGRTPGGQVAIVTRSGTSTFHGSAFEYFRHEALDANDWFAVQRRLPKPKLRQHQFGGVLGGPLGRERTFFFLSYEGLHLSQPQVRVTQVPSLDTRSAAPSSVRPLLDQFPLPNGAPLNDGSAEFVAGYSDPSRLHATSVRLDRTLGAANNLFARYSYAPSESRRRGGAFASQPLNNITRDRLDRRTLTAGLTTALGPRLAHELRVNYSRNRASGDYVVDDFGGGAPAATSVLFPRFVSGDDSSMQYQLGSQAYLHGSQGENTQHQVNVVDTLSWVAGAHQVRAGVDYRRLSLSLRPTHYFANASFTTVLQSLTGVPTTLSVAVNDASTPVFTNLSLFAQDTWRLTPSLTITYGLRWDVNPPPAEADGEDALTLENLNNPLTFAVAERGTALWNTSYRNFAPRLGVSYQLSRAAGRETTLRGGTGTFYDLGTSNTARGYTGSGFFGQTDLSGSPYSALAALTSPPTISVAPPYSFVWGFERDFKQPYTTQWNITVDQALGAQRSLSLSYVGAIGRNLLQFQGYFRPNPTFNGLVLVNRGNGRSDYDGLQLQYRHRLSNGLQALASYTLARSQDTASGDANFGLPPSVSDAMYDWGPSDFDARHVFSGAISYDLPTPPASGVMQALLSNWGVDALVRARSALPVNVYVNGGALFGLARVRPTLIPDVPIVIEDAGAAGGLRFNRAAFSVPAPLSLGSYGRNALRGFAASQVDLAIRRTVRVVGQTAVQLRAEFFNVFNHTNFADQEADLRSALFGTSTQMLSQSLGGLSAAYQVGGPRSTQLSLRFTF